MAKFGYPETLIAEESGWTALVRPHQVTLGAMVLVCQEPVGSFSGVSPAGFAGLGGIVRKSEAALRGAFHFDKINYLMLMMVDPDVHFHVIPRYASDREIAGVAFKDDFWPKPPDLTVQALQPAPVLASIRDRIKSFWPA